MISRSPIPTVAFLSFAALTVFGCSPSPPPVPDAGGNGSNGATEGERVTGSERIGWNQTAPSRQELESYEFVAYVDSERRDLGKPTCGETTAGYLCSAPLPPMSPGRHELRLAAVLGSSEGGRSEPIVLMVGASIAAPASASAAASAGAPAGPPRVHCDDSAHECYEIELLAEGLTDARSPVALADGRVLVVTEEARIRSFGPEDRGATLEIDDSCRAPSRGSIASIAADPKFETNRLLYVGWRCEPEAPLPPELLVTRYREVSGILGEAAVIYTQNFRPGTRPALSVGADDTVFVAIAGARYWSLLRMNADGTVPASNPAGSLVLMNAAEMTGISSRSVPPVVLVRTDADLRRIMLPESARMTISIVAQAAVHPAPLALDGMPHDLLPRLRAALRVEADETVADVSLTPANNLLFLLQGRRSYRLLHIRGFTR